MDSFLPDAGLHRRALDVLGIEPSPDGAPVSGPELRGAYLRRVFSLHPDRNPDDPLAPRKTMLVNEAYAVLTGRTHTPTLLFDDDLVQTVTNTPLADVQSLSYEQWLKERFYNFDAGSIWPY